MDYKEKYLGLLQVPKLCNISLDKYNVSDFFEKCILLLRLGGLNYEQIQKQLGNPPKKLIRSILLKYDSNLIDNSIKKEKQYSDSYSELYNILSHTDKKIWEIFGDDAECYISNHAIYYNGDLLSSYTFVEQTQILNEIKSQL